MASVPKNPAHMTDAEKQLRGMELAEQTTTYTVGALHRRVFRRQLMTTGLKFTEDKGLLDSLFVVKGTGRQLRELNQSARRLMD